MNHTVCPHTGCNSPEAECQGTCHEPTHAVLLSEQWGTHIKDIDTFRREGGYTQPWGRQWIKVHAYSSLDAWGRACAIQLRRSHATHG